MFGFFKKKETIPENLPAAPALDIEREMGLTEYVSVDSIKAHLVEIIDEQDENIDEMQKEINSLITKAEIAKEFAKKTQEEAKEQQQCRYWLREHLERYGNWEKVTKTQLVAILKEAMRAEQENKEENEVQEEWEDNQ